jgi:hypothetical protein
MKSNLLFFVLLFSSVLIPGINYAQSNYEDVVYLKNGSIIHGMIIEQIPNESIKIQTYDKNIFVYKLDEVAKIAKEEFKPARAEVVPVSSASVNAPVKARKEKGFINITELSHAMSFKKTHTYYDGNSQGAEFESHFDRANNAPSFGIQTVNGYQFNPYFSAGIGIGRQLYSELILYPLFLDVRAVFMKTKLSPFLMGEIGSSFSQYQVFGTKKTYHDEGGFLGSVAGGVKYFLSSKVALNLSLGLRYQELTVLNNFYDSNHNYPTYSKKSMNQLNLRFGVTF